MLLKTFSKSKQDAQLRQDANKKWHTPVLFFTFLQMQGQSISLAEHNSSYTRHLIHSSNLSILTTSSPEAESSSLAAAITFPLVFIYCSGRKENNPLLLSQICQSHKGWGACQTVQCRAGCWWGWGRQAQHGITRYRLNESTTLIAWVTSSSCKTWSIAGPAAAPWHFVSLQLAHKFHLFRRCNL